MDAATVKAMEDDELRIKIAETQGWTGIMMSSGHPIGRAPNHQSPILLPDYTKDKNATLSIIPNLGIDQWRAFIRHLTGESWGRLTELGRNKEDGVILGS